MNVDEGSEIWEEIVLKYLRKRGFKAAEEAFKQEIDVKPKDEMSLQDRLRTHEGVIEGWISSIETRDDPQFAAKAFDTLLSWVDNSLDIYRRELSRVLYPVFLHTYLNLVSRDASATASTLLNTYRRRMEDAPGGGGGLSRSQELQQVQGITDQMQLKTTQAGKELFIAKHKLRMSSFSHELLMHFLHTAPGMMSVCNVVSQHIVFELIEGAPGGFEDSSTGPDGEDNAVDVDALATNQTEVSLGLLKGNIEDLYEEERNKGAAAPQSVATADGDVGGDGVGTSNAAASGADGSKATVDAVAEAIASSHSSKKSKRERAAAAAAAAAAEAEAEAKRNQRPERVDPQPFVGSLEPELIQSWFADLDARVEVSPSCPPSCCFFTFVNSKQSLCCTAFSRDAAHVAAGYMDSTIRLYNMAQLQSERRRLQLEASARPMEVDVHEDDPDLALKPPPRRDLVRDAAAAVPPERGMSHLHGHTAPVYSVDFSHDQRMLFSGSGDGTVRLWSVERGEALASLKGHKLPVWDIAACPNGWLLASASADRTACVWASDTTRPLRKLAGHQSDVDLVRWHPNSHYVATASSDRSVRLWDVASGDCVRIMGGLRSGALTSMVVSPDGKQIACGTEEGSIHIWDLGSARKVATLTGHRGPVWSLSYSGGTGALLASGGADETVRLWANTEACGSEPAAAAGARGAAVPLSAGSSSSPALYRPLEAYRTKASATISVCFTARNLLLAAGAFSLEKSAVVSQPSGPKT